MSMKEDICLIYEQGCRTKADRIRNSLTVSREIECNAGNCTGRVGFLGEDNAFIVFMSNNFAGIIIKHICTLRAEIKICLFSVCPMNLELIDPINKYRHNLIGISHADIRTEDLQFLANGVLRGDTFLQIVPRNWGPAAKQPNSNIPDATLALTDRELEVLILIAEGATNRMIADVLFISENTAKTHVRRVLEKLQFNSRTKAALYAVDTGLAKKRPSNLFTARETDGI